MWRAATSIVLFIIRAFYAILPVRSIFGARYNLVISSFNNTIFILSEYIKAI
jgi:hypothetical protein